MRKRCCIPKSIALGLALAMVIAFIVAGAAGAAVNTRPTARTQGELGLLGIGLSEFEIDGNAIDDAAVPGDDWNTLYNGGGHQQIWTGVITDTIGRFTSGSTDLEDFPTLSWDNNAPQDKADLLHAYVAVYAGNHVFFGADRYATSGTSYMGFWLLQNPVALTGGPSGGGFSGNRTLGDVLILADFSGGGKVTILAYRWEGVDNLVPLALDPNTSFAIVDSVATPSPWPYTPKSGTPNVFPAGAFFEGGADLGALSINGCFTYFIAESRGTTNLNAELKDFVLGDLPTKPYVTVPPGDTTLCVGSPAITLCPVVKPGTGAPPFTFAWSGPGIIDPTDSCQTVGGGFAAGTYEFGVVVTGCNLCSSDTAFVTLTIAPTPTGSIDGPATVCPGSTNDHCGSDSMSSYSWSISGDGSIIGPTNGQCVEVEAGSACDGSYTLTLDFTSGAGCEGSAEKTVAVVDEEAPVITCPADITIECSDSQDPASTGSATAVDSCGGGTPAITYDDDVTPGLCADSYSIERTWTATDACGNSSSCIQTITVQDTTDPQFVGTLPGDLTVECSAVPDPATLTATDNCDDDVVVTFDQTRTDGICLDSYILTRTWTATDNCGNSVDHVQVLTVQDNTDPQFVGPLPSDATVECNQVPMPPTLTATDNCDADVEVSYEQTRTDGSCLDSYTLTRTWTATDNCGNEAEHVQILTVQDTTDPEFVGPLPEDETVECSAVPDPPTLTATDNCDTDVEVTYAQTSSAGTIPGSYILTRTWTATDNCGNDAHHVQVLTVVDRTPPDITCPSDARFECDETVLYGEASATDNCDSSPVITWHERTVPGSCTFSYDIVRTWVATDDAGNADSCDQTITIFDATDPVLACPSDITFECDNFGDPGTASASDNCDTDPVVTSSDRIVEGSCPESYTIVRTWSAEDACGNVSTCEQNITVRDTTPPEITCPPDTSFEVGEDIIYGFPIVSDRCDDSVEVTFDDSRIDGVCPDSYTIERTWTATDNCGNSASCVQTVQIGDHTPPVITCPSDRTFECNQTIVFGEATAVDVGDPDPVITFVDNPIQGDCPGRFVIGRTWIATDACGNADSCLQTVTVVDTVAPVITCPPDTSFNCDQQVEFGQATATDNCDRNPVIASSDQTIPGNSAQQYVIARTWTATDACGNSSSCVQRVSIVDRTAPVLTGAPDGRLLCAQPVVFTEPTVTDNCDSAAVITVFSNTVTQGPGACEVTYTRCWEAHDAAGNVSNRVCQTIIRYEDTVPPVIVCAPDKVIPAGEPVVFDDPTVTDNCPIPGQGPALSSNLTMSVAEGETTFTTCWFAADLCGNVSDSCCQSITLEAPPEPDSFCTFSCWNWTAACLKDPYNHEISTPPACLRDDHFFDVFPNGVTIGSHSKAGLHTALWTSPGAVERFKCGYGLPMALKADYVDPSRNQLPELAGELLTLKLNREFSCSGYFEDYGYLAGTGCLGEVVVPSEVTNFAGLTVDQFIAIADQAIAGDKSVLLPYGYSYQRLWGAARFINWMFGSCNGFGTQSTEPPVFSSTNPETGVDELADPAAAAVPDAFSMTAEPNPLHTSVTVRLALPAEGDVSIDLYDIQGRKVIELVRAHKGAGYHAFTWNGTDSFGANVVPGVYFCRVQINGEPAAMEKLMKL